MRDQTQVQKIQYDMSTKNKKTEEEGISTAFSTLNLRSINAECLSLLKQFGLDFECKIHIMHNLYCIIKLAHVLKIISI